MRFRSVLGVGLLAFGLSASAASADGGLMSSVHRPPDQSHRTSRFAQCTTVEACKSATKGSRVKGLTVSHPSDPAEVQDRLNEQWQNVAKKSDRLVKIDFVRSLCAPVGAIDGYPVGDYMCGAVSHSVSEDKNNDVVALLRVDTSGAVYYLGSPCLSSPGNDPRCDDANWKLVKTRYWATVHQTSSTTGSTTTSGPQTIETCGTVIGGKDDYRGQKLTVQAKGAVSCATAMKVMTDLSAGRAKNHEGSFQPNSWFIVDGWICPYGNMDTQFCVPSLHPSPSAPAIEAHTAG